ncbi:Mu transposase C-terminal domain-containing protein [Bacillus salipaludis]|nr:Mu transposase C-terminal domain-containing protein [Bacillus salipaludis]
MQRVPVGRGTVFILNNRKFQIMDEIERDTFIARDVEFESVEEKFTLFQILHQLELGNLEFSIKGKSLSTEKNGVHYIDDFSMLPVDKQDEAKEKYRAIEPLLKLDVKSLNPYIKKRIEDLFKEGYQVSEATLYRWLKVYKESDGDICSLVPNTEKRGAKGSKLEKEVEMIIDRIINDNYLVREARTITTIYELVRNEINKENKERELDERMKVPSVSTVRRRILDWDAYELEKARKGSNAIRNKYKQVQYNEKPKYPLQRVEIDHTQLDIMVLDDKTLLPIGRPTITCVLDVFTGYPLGVYIGFEPASYTSVMYALRNAIMPKTLIKKEFPKIKNDWHAYGLPELLVCDNGKEFLSKHLKEACLHLGIELYYCPVKKPWYKGAIERHFRTINQELLHQTPGTTFSNVVMKGDYDPTKTATIRFRKLQEMYFKWLLDYYCINKNKGVKGVPANLWKKHFEYNPRPAVPPSMLDWGIALMKLGYGSIQSTGIRRLHLFYQGSELHVLKQKLEKAGKKNKVKYKFDPSDLSKIYVYDEFDRKYIRIHCSDLEYSEGLNEYAHRVVLRKARVEDMKVDLDALAAAKAEIIQLMKDEKDYSIKKRKQNQRFQHKGTNNVLIEESPEKSIKDLEAPKVIDEPKVIEKSKPVIVEEPKPIVDMFYVDIENDWDD